MRVLQCAAATLVLTIHPASATRAEYDEDMLKLAATSGCTACHTVVPAHRREDGLPPIAPLGAISLSSTAMIPAHRTGTQTVMTGSNPSARHWVGKVGPGAMPPNIGTISEAETRMLVNWILVLVP